MRERQGEAPAGPPPPVSAELTERELEAWGRRLGPAAARWAGLVALSGPLGSGKTTLVRAAARACGAEGPVRSPTYTLVHEHPLADGGTLFHVDLYRIEGPEELASLGWRRVLGLPGPVFVEWAERAGDRLPRDRWEVRLSLIGEGTTRRVELRRRGSAPEPPSPRGEDAP